MAAAGGGNGADMNANEEQKIAHNNPNFRKQLSMVNETDQGPDSKAVNGCVVEQEKFISSKKNIAERMDLKGL